MKNEVLTACELSNVRETFGDFIYNRQINLQELVKVKAACKTQDESTFKPKINSRSVQLAQ